MKTIAVTVQESEREGVKFVLQTAHFFADCVEWCIFWNGNYLLKVIVAVFCWRLVVTERPSCWGLELWKIEIWYDVTILRPLNHS